MPKRYREVRAALSQAGWEVLRHLPDLPGAVALGATRDEVSELIREAVDAYAREIAALGQRLPEPVAATGTIQAA